MIRTIAVNQNYQFIHDLQPKELIQGDYLWYWIDFQQPTQSEIEVLNDPLHFHPLAIEDCIYTLQRPKLDYYEENTFLLHKL